MNGSAVTICLLFIVAASIFWLAQIGRDLRVYPIVVLVAAALLLAMRAGAI